MKRLISKRWYLVLFLVVCSLGLPGCYTDQTLSPQSQVYVGYDAYNHTMQILASYRIAGKISDEEYHEIEQYRVVASNALEQMKNAVDAGSDDWRAYLQIFNSALDQLLLTRLALDNP